MKTARFTTTTEDLKLIIEDSKDLNFKMEVENRPNYRDVLVEITAEEDVLFDFIDRNQLSQCIRETTELVETTDTSLPIADVSKSLAPHRCPVCNGNGLVPSGFYMQTSGHWSTSSITPETCRSCGGTGIVWG